jgi:2-methylcitrate dehydratase
MSATTVTEQLAAAAAAIRYERLPAEVVDHAKWLIIDAFACAIGAFRSDSGVVARRVAHELGGPQEATLIGERTRVSCAAAIMANQTMIRYLDYNDVIALPRGPGVLIACHPSGALPVALALAEREGASGAQLIEALVAGYEVAGRMLDAFPTSLELRGFHHGCVLPYAAAAMSAKLLHLDEPMTVHAMGIAGSLAVALDILDAEGEDYTMTKNLADGLLAERGVLGALLARQGFTAPSRVIEGNKGLAQVMFGDAASIDMPAERDRYWISDTRIKSLCAEGTTHGALAGIASIVERERLTPEDIVAIRIRSNQRTVRHTGDPTKRYPRNKETADHSTYYLAAIAVLEGRITPRSFSPAKYADPLVHSLIAKVSMEHGAEFDHNSPSAEVTIVTHDGRACRQRVDGATLKGMPQNPMNADDIRAKFHECAEGLLPSARVERFVDVATGLDTLADPGVLFDLAVVAGERS